MNEYHDRVIQQSLRWVNGKCVHNHVDDECLIDYSCCNPELFIASLEFRMDTHYKLVSTLRRVSRWTYEMPSTPIENEGGGVQLPLEVIEFSDMFTKMGSVLHPGIPPPFLENCRCVMIPLTDNDDEGEN